MIMKRIIIVIFALTFTVSLQASVTPDSVLQRANYEYIEGNFEEAAALYQSMVDSGYNNTELHFNLGNAYFKQNKIPQAILNYERAHLLDASDEDIEFNLEYARTFTVDRIEAVPVFFLTKWYRSLRSMLTSNGWAWASIAFVAILLVTGLLFWFSYRPWVKRTTFSLGILFILCIVLTSVFSLQEKGRIIHRDKAIVFQSVVTVKSSPGASSKDIFIIHAGTKVSITKAIGEWVEVRIDDGNKGWIPSESVELI
jgi:hypothetical protein